MTAAEQLVTTPDPLHDALLYAARGWRVVPIAPGTKYPKGLAAWQDAATTDPEMIRSWWTGLYKGHGVGIATGPGSGLWVLDIDDWDAWRDLEKIHGEVPETKTSITGSGGVHHLFTYPTDGSTITNANRLPTGIDVRGAGGFIVAPPTTHPNGTPYAWDEGQGDVVADAPAWLLAYVVEEHRPTPTPTTMREVSTGDRPGDLWADATDWAQILEPRGWTFHHQDRNGERYWTRPGKERRDGTSATTGWSASDNLKVFTSSVHELDEGESYTKLGFLAAMDFDGDHAAASRALAAEGWHKPDDTIETLDPVTGELVEEIVEPIGGWEFVDLDDILTGDYIAPVPTLGIRSDGLGLIYPGRVHSIAGEPGGGKTWLALWMIVEVILRGGSGALIDYEDTPSACVHRLRLLGLTNTQIRHGFHYIRPDGPLVTKGGKVDVATLSALEDLDVDLVVIDSVGESLAVEGLPPNDDDAVTQWFRRLPRMLARRGAAVVGLDHVTKSKDDRGLWAIGSQRKLAAIDGAAYGVEVSVAPTKTKDGKLKIICAKDRHGTYQRSHLVGHVTINNVDSGVQVVVTAPENKFRPTGYMEKISRLLEEIPTASGRGIEASVEGKAEHIRVALECLVDEKYVAKEVTKRGNQYSSLLAFRDNAEVETLAPKVAEPVDNPENGGPRPTASHRVPAVGDAVPGDLPVQRVPRVPDPLRSRGPAGTRCEGQGDDETTTDTTDRVPVEFSLEDLF